jgi:hypothetical protein
MLILDRRTMDDTLFSGRRTERLVHRSPIIPENHVALFPVMHIAESAVERMLDQRLEDGVSLGAIHPDHVNQMDRRERERFTTALSH